MDMTNVKIYQPGDMVAVNHHYGEPWAIGIVDKATDPQYGWTKVVVPCDGSISFLVPGYSPDAIRMATETELEKSPPWTQKFVARDRLNRIDPPILKRDITGAAYQALTTYGIKRFSQLKKMSDADLLQMKGIGTKALAVIRQWQQKTEMDLCPF